MTWWQQLLSQLISNTVIIGAASWLLSAVINNYINKNNEKYKNELTINAQLIIDKAKYELDKSMMLRQVQYEKLHNKHAELIAELYAEVADTIRASNELVAIFEPAGIPSKSERFKIFIEAFNKLVITYDRNRVYFTKSICSKMDELIAKVRENIIKFKVFIIDQREGRAPDPKATDVWTETWDALSKSVIPPLRDELDQQFKNLLGIENEKPI
jgi:hypothetical protein